MIPMMRASSRPHMLLPTMEKLNAVCSLINLLLKLKIIDNKEAIMTPAYSPGKTYYHSPRPHLMGSGPSHD